MEHLARCLFSPTLLPGLLVTWRPLGYQETVMGVYFWELMVAGENERWAVLVSVIVTVSHHRLVLVVSPSLSLEWTKHEIDD